jgi:multiple sugar transport system substrate-binding protein
MRFGSNHFRMLAVLASAAIFLAACGGGGGATPAPAGTTSVATAPGESVPAPNPTGQASPEQSPDATDAASPDATDAASPDITAGTSPEATEPATEPTPTPEPTAAVGCGEGGAQALTVGVKSEAAGADEIATTRYQMYCDANTDVAVTFTNRDFDPATFLTDVAAGQTPDVVRMTREIMGTYIAAGALDPLDQCITDHQIDTAQYYPAALNEVTWNGSIYGIPDSFETRVVLVNDSVIEEANLTPEDVNTGDWERLAQINEQLLQNEGGLTRIGFDPKLPEFLPLWARANGTSIISEDGLTAQLDDPAVIEALDFASSLLLAHGTSAEFFDFRTSGPGGLDFFGAENQFVMDTVGAFPMEVFYLATLANNSPDEEISVEPFRARDGSEITFATGAAWAIPSSAQNKDAACEFIKTVTSADAWVAAAQARADLRAAEGEAYTGTYSGNSVADETIFGQLVTEETAGNYYEGVQLVVEQMPNAFSLPPVPCGQQFRDAWQEAVQRVLEDGMSAADSLAQAQTEAQDAIDAGANNQPCP